MFVVHLLASSYHVIAGEGDKQGLTKKCEGTNSGFGAVLFKFLVKREIGTIESKTFVEIYEIVVSICSLRSV
jgi:hypothetical protein